MPQERVAAVRSSHCTMNSGTQSWSSPSWTCGGPRRPTLLAVAALSAALWRSLHEIERLVLLSEPSGDSPWSAPAFERRSYRLFDSSHAFVNMLAVRERRSTWRTRMSVELAFSTSSKKRISSGYQTSPPLDSEGTFFHRG